MKQPPSCLPADRLRRLADRNGVAGRLRLSRVRPWTTFIGALPAAAGRSVTAGTILASKLAHRCWAAYGADPADGSYRALGCSPSASMVEAQPVVGPGGNRRASLPFRPKTILPPEGKDAATTARCSSSAPSNSGTETSQAAWAGRNLLLRRRRPRTLRENVVETAADPDAIAKTDGWSGYAAVPADRHNVHVVGKTAAHLVLPWIHKSSPTSKDGREAYHGLVASICRPISMSCLSLQPPQNPPRCFPLALPPRHQCRTPYLQHVDRTGAMCISGSCILRGLALAPTA